MSSWNYRPNYNVYETAEPEEAEDSTVEGEIAILKETIEKGPLTAMNKALASLKLMVNKKFPMQTEMMVGFWAYLYALEVGNKKASASLLKKLFKKKLVGYGADKEGIYFDVLWDNTTKAQMDILVKDFFSSEKSKGKWEIKKLKRLIRFFNEYPKETEIFIEHGHLSGFMPKEVKLAVINFIMENTTSSSLLVKTFKSCFVLDNEYFAKYKFPKELFKTLFSVMEKKSKTLYREVLEEYFYQEQNIPVAQIPTEIIELHHKQGVFTKAMMKTFLDGSTNMTAKLHRVSAIKDEKLRSDLVNLDKELLSYAINVDQSLLHKSTQNFFHFPE